jgi:hypothetical protein
MHYPDFIKAKTEEQLKEKIALLFLSKGKEFKLITIATNKDGEWVCWFWSNNNEGPIKNVSTT